MSMKPKVFVSRKLPPEVKDYLDEHCEVSLWDRPEPITREQLLASLAEAEGLLTADRSINRELLDHAPRLKVVSNVSVGYNNFDLTAMKERGVTGTNTAGSLNDTVADLIFALMLDVARRVSELDQYVKAGQWKRGDGPGFFGLDVHHKKLGIIGMGEIGEAVAHRGKFGFGMEVLYYNRSRRPDTEASLEARYLPMDELLEEADFLVLMTPLTPETRHLIGAREFALMKPTAVFVNASRGATVDEAAMVAALQNGQIYGAGLDVYEHEPIAADHPLLKLRNVVTLPHIGSATDQTRRKMAMVAAHNLVAALEGRIPPNLVKELRP